MTWMFYSANIRINYWIRFFQLNAIWSPLNWLYQKFLLRFVGVEVELQFDSNIRTVLNKGSSLIIGTDRQTFDYLLHKIELRSKCLLDTVWPVHNKQEINHARICRWYFFPIISTHIFTNLDHIFSSFLDSPFSPNSQFYFSSNYQLHIYTFLFD